MTDDFRRRLDKIVAAHRAKVANDSAARDTYNNQWRAVSDVIKHVFELAGQRFENGPVVLSINASRDTSISLAVKCENSKSELRYRPNHVDMQVEVTRNLMSQDQHPETVAMDQLTHDFVQDQVVNFLSRALGV